MSDDNVSPPIKSGSSKNRRVVGVMIGIMIVVIGLGVFFWFHSFNQNNTVASQDSNQSDGAVYYVKFKQPFVFNVHSDHQRSRIVQVKVQLMVKGERSAEDAEAHLPLMRSTLLDLFSTMTVEQLRQINGSQALRDIGLSGVKSALAKVNSPALVEKMLLTGFVMQ